MTRCLIIEHHFVNRYCLVEKEVDGFPLTVSIHRNCFLDLRERSTLSPSGFGLERLNIEV
jgi:hypothetical protein